MPRIDFASLPEHARLWVFAADRMLTPAEADHLLATTDAFLDQWAAHGVPLTAGRDWRFDQFLFVAVDEKAAGVSGCSIDALVRGLKALEQELGASLLDHSPVMYRNGESIDRVTRPQFADLVTSGSVTRDTPVFNNTIPTVGDLRAGRWEVPAAKSWHGGAFF